MDQSTGSGSTNDEGQWKALTAVADLMGREMDILMYDDFKKKLFGLGGVTRWPGKPGSDGTISLPVRPSVVLRDETFPNHPISSDSWWGMFVSD